MTTKKDDTTDGTDDDTQEPKDDTSTGDSGGDDPSGLANVRKVVQEVVQEELAKLKDVFTGGDKDKGDKPPIPNRAGMEAEAERLVRNALKGVVKEQEHEHDHKTLREATKPASEAAPKTVRKLTKALWGGDE